MVVPQTHWTDIDVADPTTSSELGNFLERPLEIYSGTWTQAEAVGVKTTLQPWSLYLNNAVIRRKLDNYGYIRGNLRIKILMNASPFYYGAMLFNYTPMAAFHGRPSVLTNDMFLIPESQKPGIFVYPQDNKGGEMVLPFYYHQNYLRLSILSDVQNMGDLKLIIYDPLKSANGATGSVSIQIMAWMEEVVLAGPTYALALQSQDEYGNGPVSAPASTLARLAGMLKKAPVIGKFATATEIGAKAVSGIAQIFGFSNVPIIDPIAPMTLQLNPTLATSQISYPVQKMTFDPKAELTVDNSAIGFSSEDELTVSNLVQKRSYLGYTIWSSSDPVDTNLFSARVTPSMYDHLPITGGSQLNMTPLDMVARMFGNWRGDIIFTFRVVCSKYHKGRLRVAYDPVFPTLTTETGEVVQNTLYDLGNEEEEFEFRVPYSAATSWLATRSGATPFNNWSPSGAALTPSTVTDNGLLLMKVVTLLTAPATATSVRILFFVRGAENFEVSNAKDIEGNLTSFVLQSQDEHDAYEESVETTGGTSSDIISVRNRVYFGEQVRSLRHLLRRYSFLDRVYPGVSTAATYTGVMNRFPTYFGYDPNGISLARNTAGSANAAFNWSQPLPYHLLTQCFLGQRGSINWLLAMPNIGNYLKATRLANGSTTTATALPWPATTDVLGYNFQAVRNNYLRGGDSAGGALISTGINNTLNFQAPDMTGYKFHSTASGIPTSWGADPAARSDGVRVQSCALANTNTMALDRYVAVGTDFNLVYFMYVPTMYLITSVPAVAV